MAVSESQIVVPPLLETLVARTLRVPATATTPGDGARAARQLDVALMSVGFKLSKDLLEYLSGHAEAEVTPLARQVLSAVRTLVGDHVQHNVYFKDFPNNVPDTLSFWLQQATHMFFSPQGGLVLAVDLDVNQVYGRYQHSYEAMLEAHEAFLPSLKDRIKVLGLGDGLEAEMRSCYRVLASSTIPLNEADRTLLERVADVGLDAGTPGGIPVRENLAIVNKVRATYGRPVEVDTIADVLRLACALSDGDVTLQEPTKFKSLPRPLRRLLMAALDDVVSGTPAKLGDVARYREPLKRLGERLHPHEHPFGQARDVFAVARGDRHVTSLAGRVEVAFVEGRLLDVLAMLRQSPGQLVRSLDRILCRMERPTDFPEIVEAFREALPQAAARVLLSLRQHLDNRVRGVAHRFFANSRARAWVAPETRDPLAGEVARPFLELIDQEMLRRLPAPGHLVVDPAVGDVALPTSDKNRSSGFGVMPRGSVLPVESGLVRFFVYWKQAAQRTDLDLSAVLLDQDYHYVDHLSYTNLKAVGGVHSGDVTEAPNGASEFIDIDLQRVPCACVVPMVNVFAGEQFTEVAECFFGFMQREHEQAGKPFEAATVRMKSDVRGTGRVCVPLAFVRDAQGRWSARWLNLYLMGQPQFNMLEGNERSATLLTRALAEQRSLRVDYLVDLLMKKATSFSWHDEGTPLPVDATMYIGIQAVEGLPRGAKSFTLTNLHELVPK